MITDKDIIIELLRQREDLETRLSGERAGLNSQVDFAALIKEIGELRGDNQKLSAWKNEALGLLGQFDTQKIGELLGLTLGTPVLENVEPGIRKLIEERDRIKSYSEKRIAELLDQIDSLKSSLEVNSDLHDNDVEVYKEEYDKIKGVLESCNFPELRKMLRIPEGETLSTQLVNKVQELMLELANAKHEAEGLKKENEVLKGRFVTYPEGHIMSPSVLQREYGKPLSDYGQSLQDQTLKQPTQNQ